MAIVSSWGWKKNESDSEGEEDEYSATCAVCTVYKTGQRARPTANFITYPREGDAHTKISDIDEKLLPQFGGEVLVHQSAKVSEFAKPRLYDINTGECAMVDLTRLAREHGLGWSAENREDIGVSGMVWAHGKRLLACGQKEGRGGKARPVLFVCES